MRALRILLILTVVLGGLFVAADRIAVGLAESEAAEKVKVSQGLAETPEFSINGFPFLTQVLSKELDEVEMNLDGATAAADGQPIRITRMTAVLRDVVIGNNFSTATATNATGSASISYEDLSKAADDGIAIGYGGTSDSGKPQVEVTASLDLPTGQGFEHSVVSTVSVTDGETIRLRADEVPGSEIPGVEELVRAKIDMDVQINGLPHGLELETIKPTKGGVDITFSGRQVSLAG